MELCRPILESPFLSWRDLISPDVARLLPYLQPWRSLDGELRRYFGDERIRLALTFQSKYLGMSPFNCPSLFSILAFLEYEYGVFHPVGGCGAVSRAMANVAEDLGVEIALDDEVEEITFDGRRATGLRSKSGLHRADAIVINADFARAMHRLVPNRLRRRWTDARIARKRFSCSTFMLYLGVDGRFPDLAHHTIYLARNYRENLDDIEDRHVLSSTRRSTCRMPA
jgi:phytoene desaturase